MRHFVWQVSVDKPKGNSIGVLGMIFITLQLIGLLVVCWAGYTYSLGTYSRSCEIIQKKILMR
jgi:hypothetical protein